MLQLCIFPWLGLLWDTGHTGLEREITSGLVIWKGFKPERVLLGIIIFGLFLRLHPTCILCPLSGTSRWAFITFTVFLELNNSFTLTECKCMNNYFPFYSDILILCLWSAIYVISFQKLKHGNNYLKPIIF